MQRKETYADRHMHLFEMQHTNLFLGASFFQALQIILQYNWHVHEYSTIPQTIGIGLEVTFSTYY